MSYIRMPKKTIAATANRIDAHLIPLTTLARMSRPAAFRTAPRHRTWGYRISAGSDSVQRQGLFFSLPWVTIRNLLIQMGPTLRDRAHLARSSASHPLSWHVHSAIASFRGTY